MYGLWVVMFLPRSSLLVVVGSITPARVFNACELLIYLVHVASARKPGTANCYGLCRYKVQQTHIGQIMS